MRWLTLYYRGQWTPAEARKMCRDLMDDGWHAVIIAAYEGGWTVEMLG